MAEGDTGAIVKEGSTLVEQAKDATRSVNRATRKMAKKVSSTELSGPSPNIKTNLAIADIALRGGSMAARLAIEHALLGKRYEPKKAKRILKGRSIAETMLHAGLARIALTSIPGAIIVGGGMIAKTLYDHKRSRKSAVEGEEALHRQAERGKEEE